MTELRQAKRKITLVNHGARNNQPQYIVIHFVGASGQAIHNADYFYNTYREASAHYFIDPNETYLVVPEDTVAWHVGDGLGAYGITNSNSIGIEGCQDVTTGPNVWHWDFHSKTREQMLLLTKHLMAKYNIPLSRVVRHYDASRKICPGNWQWNDWAKWKQFKNDLAKMVNVKETPVKPVAIPEAKGSKNDMYEIEVGDTLSKIAKKFKVTVKELVEWNKIKNPNVIYPGSKLVVKKPMMKGVYPLSGAFRFNCTVNVRNQPKAVGEVPARYFNGEVVNYDSLEVIDGMIWLQYVSRDGKKRFISAGETDDLFGKFL